MKLNYEIIQNAVSRLNTIGDREIDFRGTLSLSSWLTIQTINLSYRLTHSEINKHTYMHTPTNIQGLKIEQIENLTMTRVFF